MHAAPHRRSPRPCDHAAALPVPQLMGEAGALPLSQGLCTTALRCPHRTAHHGHGAAPNRFMAHVAMHQNGESGGPVTWGEHVSDEQYATAPRP